MTDAAAGRDIFACLRFIPGSVIRAVPMEDQEVPLENVHEHIEHHAAGAREKWVSLVALTTAVLAAMAAITALLAGDHANEAMLDQIQSSDQWSYYQAKGIKAAVLETKIDIRKTLGYQSESADMSKSDRYAVEQDEIKKLAEEKQTEARTHLRKHVIMAKGVTFFQIAIAVSAISILTKRRVFWYLSIGLGIFGCHSLIHGLLVQ